MKSLSLQQLHNLAMSDDRLDVQRRLEFDLLLA